MRGLLWCGVVGGPLFVVVFLLNDRVRDDYDPVRDFVSEAAIGPGGWVQITNFVVTGVLMIAFALAVSRAVTAWTGRLVGLFGFGLISAGIFVSDPVPTSAPTWHGAAHNAVSLVVFVALPAACFTAARWLRTPAWSWYCRAVGVAVPVLFVLAGGSEEASGVFQRLCIAIGWTWLATLGLRAFAVTTRASAE